jgi:hypothetical protein
MSRAIGVASRRDKGALWPSDILDGASQSNCLIRYLEGWADANPLKILAATARGYRFDDPLVGIFTRRSLRRYFELVRSRFAFEAPTAPRDVAFRLHGPMAGLSGQRELQFWREAPSLGLTGVTVIVFGKEGVVAERVAYDLNMASAVLSGGPSGCRTITDEQC